MTMSDSMYLWDIRLQCKKSSTEGQQLVLYNYGIGPVKTGYILITSQKRWREG